MSADVVLLESLLAGDRTPALAAKNLMNNGLLLIAAAFDISHERIRPWTFSAEVKEKAREQGIALWDLFKASALRQKYTAPTERKPEFERFMQIAMGAPKGKPRRERKRKAT